MNHSEYFEKKKIILEQISNLLKKELASITMIDEFEKLTENENDLINSLKKLDLKFDNHKLTESQKIIVENLIVSIYSLKQEIINKFEKEFENFQKNSVFIQTRKDLVNTYFQKGPVNPRFIDKLN
ncbi:hypothetical protein KA977_04355 [Candidatus Dependentiae bacterium]|nr:hypothetical protein [Candidatus Dependentiae bacterium]